MDKVVQIFTDGACSGNPGPGGWAALLRYGSTEKIISGYCPNTTNNRMEMVAAIEGLKLLKRPSKVVLTTDSSYVLKGITVWIKNWHKKGWLKNDKIKNADLWQELDLLNFQHQVTWEWVRGHTGHIENEIVDEAARREIKRNS
ncbi:MAG: ribonuclease HI [Gammaproteobacteria bacterium]|nr:ribonuclease HI [Gammaproteobacteria bacterium]